MAVGLTVEGDARIRGAVIADQINPTTGTVGDNEVKGSDPITGDKLYHRYHMLHTQKHGTATAAERRVVHVAKEAGNIGDVRAGVVVACTGDSTISIAIKKNGTNILNAPIVLDNSNTAFSKEQGTFSVDTYVSGDVLEVDVTVSAGTGTLGQGLFVDMWADEIPVT